MDRLYAIKRPLEYSDVVKKDQLLRSIDTCVTKYDEFVLGCSDENFRDSFFVCRFLTLSGRYFFAGSWH